MENNVWKHPMNDLEGKFIYRTGLNVFNSLTNKLEEFVTKDGSKNVNWYMCGPTVYDSSHLGHARTYLSFDTIRRIMTNYFGYDVNMSMNITDIDDKIINRSNEQGMAYTQFARMWEESFFEDMKVLNVQYPTSITRVSEYVPEIIKFIEVLIEKKYAYEMNGSVYFNISEFTKNGHVYAKLVPININDDKTERNKQLKEAEGSLIVAHENDKKSDSDFVLWKKSKINEPFWESPWGQGRPGWHIECSAMCASTFGSSLDIHSGGCDLKFPHHDNEIAQTEAFYDYSQWINYFLHTGHLNIEGLKMSKSLKNFKKIGEFTQKFNPNTFRIYFSMSRWDGPMDFTETGLSEAFNHDKYIGGYFQNAKVWMRENDLKKNLKFTEVDNNILKILTEKKKIIHDALCDNFDTGLVLKVLKELINKTYEYQTKSLSDNSFKIHIIYTISQFIASITKSFGLIYRTEFIDFFIFDSSEQSSEQILSPYIDALAKFRDSIKTLSSVDKDLIKVLKSCDELRDDILPYLGVKIEDRGKGIPSVWKFYDKETYVKEILKQKEIAELAKIEKEQRNRENELKNSTPAREFYNMQNDKYSKFDEEGVPTHDLKGFEISKEIKNKIKKEFKKHEENHLKWIEKNKLKNDSNLINIENEDEK